MRPLGGLNWMWPRGAPRDEEGITVSSKARRTVFPASLLASCPACGFFLSCGALLERGPWPLLWVHICLPLFPPYSGPPVAKTMAGPNSAD